mmetsp:Transcript_3462/g.5779  ORF Transcript_3462/g.5779 Transcript_3462/m.5779 type:complete len:362 (-) Transcript_3462:96-1181(-)|eukprot:CAMPEP_0119015928 /NCGR_PEP_ID=MMETSP1176-20130426/11725_1 /TAXON_ID=265551 /ORGANISM="Synedropsis recta cf, Strain CCMP1620" /LENGTH=361 /DNA_ID=CAMNT_0006969253 /DNA_START=73 /DNA_END=1158 /DNA_ORIENTATION=-
MQNNNSDLLSGHGGYGQLPSLSDVLASLSQRQSLGHSAADRLLTEASVLGSVGGVGGSHHADLVAALTARSSGLAEYAAARDLASRELLQDYGSHNSDPLLFASAIAAKRQLELAKAARRDALMNEAYKRGREEALLSLVRLNGYEESLHNQPPPVPQPSSGALSLLESAARISSTDQQSLSNIGNSDANTADRRKKNSPYVDASSLKDPDPVLLANRRARGGVTEPFPEKLHRMLQEVEAAGNSGTVSFFAHGRAFAVHNPTRFVTEIMPKYFRQSRLSSFQRQLNLYGFTRITQGPDAGGYYHELFLKGRSTLCVHMRRVGVPQGPAKGANKVPSNEPDFYNMNPVATKDEGGGKTDGL